MRSGLEASKCLTPFLMIKLTSPLFLSRSSTS